MWYSTTNLKGAQQWHDEIGRALNRCDWFLVLLTPASARAKWVKQELLFALNEKRYEQRIVPVLVRDCRWKDLSWTLGALQRVRLEPYEGGCRELLALWGVELDSRRVTEPLPRRAAARKKG